MDCDLDIGRLGLAPKKCNIRISSLNARGLRNKNKRICVAQWFKKQNIDILCVQETYCTDDLVKKFDESFKPFSDEIIHCLTDSEHSRGTTIIVRKGLNLKIENIKKKENGRQLILNAKLNDRNITIVNVYAPNDISQRIKFFKRTATWVKQNIEEDNILILCGDFNSVTNSEDRTTGKVDKCGFHFQKLTNSLKMIDTFKTLNPDTKGYTWVDPADPRKQSRLDYIFVTHFLQQYLKHSLVDNAPVPDHKAVITDINMNTKTRGPGYWKMNTSILKDNIYRDDIEKLMKDTIEEYSEIESKRVIWDLCKIRIKEYSIRFCIDKARKENSDFEKLNIKLNEIDSKIAGIPENNEILIKERKHIKNEMNQHILQKAKGFQIRSRAQWQEEGEKNTQYFARLESRRQTNNNIQMLKTKQDPSVTVQNDQDILNEACLFYNDLYTSKAPTIHNIKEYLNTITFQKKLSQEDKDICDDDITENECLNVLKHMKDNKAPGIDGIPVEFYKTFWPVISKFLLEVYHEAFQHQELSYSQRTAIISLIFKKGDRLLLKNYRPISLSTADYKILAFVLAARLQKVLNKIIESSQAGYIKKRFIGQNIRLIEDLIDYAENLNDDSMIFFLDFEKAFDSVEWDFIHETLIRFNFGDTFIKWVKTLYNDAQAKIKNHGWLSKNISIKRGIRQGCPVSALLFIIVVEVLAIDIKSNKEIKGISISFNNHIKEIKICQYADDGHLFLYNQKSLDNAINTINRFSKVAGPKLNIEKCEKLLLNDTKNREQNTYYQKNAKCLGVMVGKDKMINEEKNWTEKLEKMKNCLHVWKTRNLTLFGKITVIKMMALPKLSYSATNTTIPDTTIKTINRILFDFLWNGRDRIKRHTLIGNIIDGGIAMTDIQSYFESLKASWVNRYLTSIECNEEWSIIMKKYVDLFGPNNIIFHMNFQSEEVFPYMDNVPKFYKEVFTSFNKSKSPIKPETTEQILNTIIWGNRFITYAKKRNKKMTLYSKEWIKSNIICVKDLLITNNEISIDYIYNKLDFKGHIFGDLTKLKIALRPYLHLVINNIPDAIIYTLPHEPTFNRKTEIIDVRNKKSKFFYTELIKNIFMAPDLTKFLHNNNEITHIPEIKQVFTNKLEVVKENKLKEFNYKILNKIIPCGQLLSKWVPNISNMCDECNSLETQEHVIIFCPKTLEIWKEIDILIDENINAGKIIFGMDKATVNNLISQISYSIHKYWLIRKSENNKYDQEQLKQLIKQDLHSKIQLFSKLKYLDLSELYNNIVQNW